jgi:L-rhamnose-H+ transport protein
MHTILIGLAVVAVAGVLNGSFAFPMKRMEKWEWENIWIMWAFWALIVSCWTVALGTVPNLLGVYREVPPSVILSTFLLGIGGGLGMVTFGMGIHLVGLSLGFSIILGITAVSGSLIPMLILSPGTLLTFGGGLILLGLLVTIGGVALCGSAGILRERSLRDGPDNLSGGSRRFKLGLLVCVASGILNAMINLSFVCGNPIGEIARTHIDGPGVDFRASNAIWAVAFIGAFLPNALYCGWLLVNRGSWKKFVKSSTRHYWLWTLLMGAMWMTGYALYGAGVSMLGELGSTIGWITLFAITVMSGNVCGLLAGEWEGTPGKARSRMMQGIALLLASIVLVALGGAE